MSKHQTKQRGFTLVELVVIITKARAWIRHCDGAVYGFSEGHAKWLKPEKTWRSLNDNYWRRNPVIN
jgi:hypothetical protein